MLKFQFMKLNKKSKGIKMRSNNFLKVIVAGIFAVSAMNALAADKNGCGSDRKSVV